MGYAVDLILMVPDRKQRWDTVKTTRILRSSRGFASGLCERPWNSQELCTYTHSPDTRQKHRRLAAYSRTCYSVTRVHENTRKSGRFNSCICLCTMKILRRSVDEALYSCYNRMLAHKCTYALLLWLYYYLTRDGYFILWICTHRLEQIWYMVMEVFTQEAYLYPDTLIQ